MQVDFYHLTRAPVDRVLPRIAERVLTGGDRLLVVTEDKALADKIDQALWSYSPGSFLPHGQAGEGVDADQPVLIATDVTAANAARHIALADAQWRDAALDFDRVFHFFDEDSIAAARAAWRGLAGRNGVESRYWRQDESGKWERVA